MRLEFIKKNRIGFYGDRIDDQELKYDKFKIFYAPVLFLERKKFKKCLNKLKKLLKKCVINKELANTKQSQLSVQNEEKVLLDDNYLSKINEVHERLLLTEKDNLLYKSR